MENIPNGQVLLLQMENERLRTENAKMRGVSERIDRMCADGWKISDIERSILTLEKLQETDKKLNKQFQLAELVYGKMINYLMNKYKIPDDEWDMIDEFQKDFIKRRSYLIELGGRLSKSLKNSEAEQKLNYCKKVFETLINELMKFCDKDERKILRGEK